MLLQDPVARRLLIASAAAVIFAEIVVSSVGRARNRQGGGGPAVRQDRGTLFIVGLGMYLAVSAAVAIAKVPGLRAGADNWWTFGLGLALVFAGAGLRDWSILTLGRWFRRDVTIEPGQTLIRRGPYRWLRHPSYSGLALIVAGFGLAIGSWVGAAAALVIVVAGLVPRIRVEEAALARTFGAEYTAYASSTWRLVPHIW